MLQFVLVIICKKNIFLPVQAKVYENATRP